MNVTIISNPAAGKRGGEGTLAAASEVLEEASWTVSIRTTNGPGDAQAMATQAVCDGEDAVLVAGGDGTVNETIQALAGTKTALGYLPYGTVNVWARELGLPLDSVRAARELVHGVVREIDLGIADERYFLLMAGVGFDAEVIRRSQSLERHKQRYGVLPYVATGLSAAPFYGGADIELRYDGVIRRVQALMLVIGNTRLYAGRLRLTPCAIANDGWLDLCIMKGRGPVSLVRQSFPLLVSGSIAYSDVEMLRVREVQISAAEALPVQVDGELAGTTPLTCKIVPGALRVIVPQGLDSGLIA